MMKNDKIKKRLKKLMIGIMIVFIVIAVGIKMNVRYITECLHFDFIEYSDHLDIEVSYIAHFLRFHSYTIEEESEGIYILKIKVSDIIGENYWPQTITIDKEPSQIKAIELSDGKEGRIIYPQTND